MVTLSSYKQYYYSADATAEAWHMQSGKTAYLPAGKVTGTGYFPAMTQFDGSTGYYTASPTFAGNKGTLFGKLNLAKKNNGIAQYVVRASGSASRMGVILTDNDHAITADRNTLNFLVWDSAGTIITRLYSAEGVDLTNQDLVFFASYDGDLGLATFIINGQNGDSITHPNRIAPTTATLSSGAGQFTVGATYTPSHFADGRIGAIGYRDAYLTNWSDFMHIDGALKPLDESTWTEWGAQPMFWHEAAKMDENKGSAGAMTKNGSITLASAIP